MKEFTPKDLGTTADKLNESIITDDLDIKQIVYRLLLSINNSRGVDEAVFASLVKMLIGYIPINKKYMLDEKTDEYISEVEKYEYKFWCGVPMGTVEHPVNGSPWLTKNRVTDWDALYEIVLEILEKSGLTWKTEDYEKEVKKVEEPKPQPTPLRENIYNAPKLEEPKQLSQKRGHICYVCKEPVDKVTNPAFHRPIKEEGKEERGRQVHILYEALANEKYGFYKRTHKRRVINHG